MFGKYKQFPHNVVNTHFLKKVKNESIVKKIKSFYDTKCISSISKEYKTRNFDYKNCIFYHSLKSRNTEYDSKNTQIIDHEKDGEETPAEINKKAKYNNKYIQIIDNEKDGEETAAEINKNDIIAIDFEGTNLGRYGKICLMQVYIEKRNIGEVNNNVFEKYYIFDLLKQSIINSVKKIIENKKTLKLIHDCREDSSALYNQLGIKFENVYDISRAHMLLQEKRKEKDVYQVGFTQLIYDYLGIKDDCLNDIKKEMCKNDKLWETRPLSNTSIIYALKNVKYLLPLYNIFDKLLPKKKVLEKSKDFVNYCFLNSRFKLPTDLAKRGNIIEAMLVSKSMLNCVFKLNSTRKGIACTPSSVAQFRDVNVGDVVLCVVSNKSIDQKILYLCKHDDVYDYWNLKDRPRGKFKPSIHENTIDPMIECCEEEKEDLD
ncbi:exonuclease, putative [Hepatocystis sp. ex Piliocolobus tephrosceles]|nr:exonuclease, putative [Hepatocystis sp. ex Piliocolobus tephrosceles]